MAMTPSQLSIIVKSQGVEKAAQDLDKLAKAAASVDAETKAFVIAQSKLADSNQKVGKSSEATARGISVQELALIKAHEAALKMNATVDRQVAAQDKLNNTVQMTARGVTQQELAMIRAHEQALKMNVAFDKQADSLKNVSHHGNIFNNTLRSMATATLAYMGVNFFAGIIKQADAWAMMQSKLSLAVGGMENAKRVQNDLYELSQRLRVPLDDTVKLYTRMAVPLEKMGKGTAETKTVVESFSTALKLAGATGQEAASAMLQFSQSINAGRLNGGEFNSIAEASPNVLRAVERELVRTGRGAELAAKGLKNLAADGKLTTKILVDALANAAPQWRKEFESLPLTVDGALERIKNAWKKSIGEIGQDTKFNQKMAESLKKLEDMLPSIARGVGNAFAFVIDNAETLINVLKVLAATFVLVKIGAFLTGLSGMVTAAKSAATAVEALTVALKFFHMTPVGLLLLGIAAAGTAIYLAFKNVNKETDKTIENKKALADSNSLLASMKAETLELMKQADAARAKIGLPAIYAKEIAASAPIIQEQQKRLIELTLANTNLFIAEKKIRDYKKANKLDTDYYIPPNMKEELKSAQERVNKIKEINKLADEDSAKQADAKALRDAARRGEERQKLITDAREAAKTEAQIAKEKRDKAIELMKEQASSMNLDSSTPEGRSFLRDSQIKIERDYQNALEKTKKAKTEEAASDMILKHQEYDQTEKLLKIRDDYTKSQDKQAQNASVSLESAQAELDKVNALIQGYDDKKQALIDLQITEAIAEQNKSSSVVRTAQEIFALSEKIRVLKELKGAQSELSGLDSGKKAFEDYEKFMDSTKVDKFGKSFTDSMGKAGKSVASVSKVLENMSKTYSTLNKQQDNLRKAKETGFITEERYQQELANIESSRFGTAMNLYGDMAEAAKGFFEEGSKGYKTLDGISKVVHAAQLARNLVEMGQLAVKAVMTQAGGDPYSAWVRMGAMAAAMAALGFAVGGGFNKSAGGVSAADVQKTQGTGSVFGDASAKSDSVKASLDLLKSSFDKLYPVNQGMLKALKNIESSMTGLTNLVVRSGGIVEGSNLGIKEGTLSKSSMSWTTALILGGVTAPILKLLGGLWGKTTQNIVDSGLQFGGSLQSMKQGQGFSQYASVDTTKSSWFGLKKDTTNSVQTEGLGSELNNQFAMIFTNMQKTLEEAGKVLYGSSSGVTKALEEMVFEVSKVSLKGLSGQALTDAINGVVSKALDQMAGAAFSSLEKFREVGEGYAQTVVRVANTFSVVNATFDKLGMKMYEMNDAGISSAMTFVKLFDSMEEMQSVASNYYDKFYTEQEKQAKITDALRKQFSEMNLVLPTSAKAYRELVDNTTDPAKVAQLWKLSDAFAEVFGTIENSANKLPAIVQTTFESLTADAEKWLALRNQAMSLKDSIDEAMGGKKDPATRIKQLWDALSSDTTVEQKMSLAGELKDLLISKYQVEKDNIQKLIDLGKQFKSYVEGLKVGSLSPLTMAEKLSEAQKQYEETLTKAQGGDTIAQGALTGKADAYLQLAQTALAGSSGYQAVFNNITASLEALGVSNTTASETRDANLQKQVDELTKLRDFAASTEALANAYYVDSLKALTEQLNIMNMLYVKMGDLTGLATSFASLPAEIAALIKGQVGASSNTDFVKSLYGSYAGKFGDMIDPEGMSYWMSEVEKFGRDYATKAFQSSAQIVSGSPAVANTNTEITSMKAEMAALVAELKGLREDQAKQTGDIIAATVISNKENANTVVSGVVDNSVAKSWAESNYKGAMDLA